MNMEKLIFRAVITLVIILAVFIAAGLYNGLKIQKYTIDSEKINNPIRIAQISDLHSCGYGDNQEKLINAIDRQRPDIVALTGDIFDDVLSDEKTEIFLKGIAGRYPIYYVTGNHEYWSGEYAFSIKMDILRKYGVTILSNELRTMEINGETINICGVNDPSSRTLYPDNPIKFNEEVEYVRELSRDGNFSILLSHRPEFIDLYAEQGFDLVLCGHAHGGQWRIPKLLNGLYSPNQGLFPKYAGGVYKKGSTTVVVSRGLSKESSKIPRFYNRPEIVIIDLV